MPVVNPEIRKFVGLYLQKNSFNTPEGAMEKATDIIIEQDDRISKLRGFYTYFSPGAGDILNNLYLYQNKLMVAFDDKLSYLTESGTAPNLIGTETSLSGKTVNLTNRVARFAEASSNLYLTSNDGVLKTDAYNGKLYESGTPSGLDLQATWYPAVNGFIPAGMDGTSLPVATSLGYRVVFGRRDANSLEILGAPSDSLILTNSVIPNCDYTSSGSGPSYTVTVTSPNHQLLTGAVLATKGSNVAVDGTPAITVVDADSFTFSVPTDPTAEGTVSYSAARSVRLEGSIPHEIADVTDGYFMQIYRSSIVVGEGLVPDPDYRMIEERVLTSEEIAAHLFYYVDETLDALVRSQPFLYTNPSQEGEAQANFRPPLCNDLTVFKDCLIAAGCTTRHTLPLSLVDTSVLADGDYFEVKLGTSTHRYVARPGVGNATTVSTSIGVAGSTITVTSIEHGLKNGDKVFISNATGVGTMPSGNYAISNITVDTFDFTSASATSISHLEFQGVEDASGYSIFTLLTTESVGQQLSWTARHFIKAINRDSDAPFYARYVSGVDDTPGMIRIDAEDFGDPIYIRANGATEGTAFAPELPVSFSSGTQIFSKNDKQPHIAYCSKPGESEAFPLANDVKVGEKNGEILRAVALRDSCILIKADGVYRMTGDDPGNFNVILIDGTIFCIAPSSVQLLNNQVYFLSNQGVCVVTESAATIISREKIEDVITPIIGKDRIASDTGAIGYESNRTYRLSTIGPNSGVMSSCWIYNFINDTWTEQSQKFTQGAIGPNDRLYLISYDAAPSNRVILKERKDYQRTDYCGQHYAGLTVQSVAPDKLSAEVLSPNYPPVDGDILVKSSNISRIKSVTSLGGNVYHLEFRRACNLVASDTDPILYRGYRSEWTFAPYHAGQVGMMKKFSKMHIHTRSPAISQLSISFSGYLYGGSSTTVWEREAIEQGEGWGNGTWGYFPWGEADSLSISSDTKPSIPIRILVPQYQQRTTFIKASFVHDEAGEAIDMQALVFGVRSYQERVSK